MLRASTEQFGPELTAEGPTAEALSEAQLSWAKPKGLSYHEKLMRGYSLLQRKYRVRLKELAQKSELEAKDFWLPNLYPSQWERKRPLGGCAILQSIRLR